MQFGHDVEPNADALRVVSTKAKGLAFSRFGTGLTNAFVNLAEREGFEPSVRGYRTPDFESGTFDHSATSPNTTLQHAPEAAWHREGAHFTSNIRISGRMLEGLYC